MTRVAYANGIRFDVDEAVTNLKGWDRQSEAQYINLRDQPRSHKINDPHHWCMSCALFSMLSDRRARSIARGETCNNENTPPRVTKSMPITGIHSIWMIWRDHPETPYWRDGVGWIENRPTPFRGSEEAAKRLESILTES